MWYIICVVVSFLACGRGEESTVTVVTNVGTIRGLRTGGLHPFIKFLGIPYGKVEESDPFAAAEPHPHFTTPYSAIKDPPICPQIVNGVPQGNVHCLHLNVYKPDNATTNNLPVMVYIHGGGFIEGNGNFETQSPMYLVKNDVIVVAVNYRLGAYGFLCLPDLGYSNQGFKDVILALKWIKDNINGFGGDENNILLFGHSAGSGIAEFLLLYNEDNVFNKVILQSLNIASPYIRGEPANETYVATVAQKLGFNTEHLKTEDVIKQLSSVDTDLLINITKADELRPCVDGIFTSRSPKKFNMKDKRIIIGSTSAETMYFYNSPEENYINKFRDDLDKGFVGLSEDIVDNVKKFYLTDDMKSNVIDFGTDYVFNYPALRSIRYYLANNATVYYYIFSHDGERNYMKRRENLTGVGAAHGDELGYLFEMDILKDPFNKEDGIVSEVMAEMWANFAKYGNPTPQLTNHIHQLWPAVGKDVQQYMNISYVANFSVQEGPYHDRMAFWDAFYDLYGKNSVGYDYGEEYTRRVDQTPGESQEILKKMIEFL